jgi:hypothetical protein
MAAKADGKSAEDLPDRLGAALQMIPGSIRKMSFSAEPFRQQFP